VAGSGACALDAHAVDGCLVLLCLAAPSWRSIPQCVPPIRQLLHDLARGRPFPTCAMSGPGTSARLQIAHAPSHCPPQYTREVPGANAPTYRCDFAATIAVDVSGASWSRTWWNSAGDSVTEFLPAAKAQLGAWNSRFDDDYAAWQASLPPPPPCTDC
jgi:hypothetical protein